MKRYLMLLVYVTLLFVSLHYFIDQRAEPITEDRNRLLPVKMKAIKTTDSTAEIQQVVLDANSEEDPIAIAGMQHSQGGHTEYPDGILLDMKPYNKILAFDAEEKTITVQSGATWRDIQDYINPYGLALKVSQSQNIFTIGGSLSVNAHGLDIRHGSLIDTVESLRLLDANGEILTLSPEQNTELFQAVVGGYGLFGIILDVTLRLTDDEMYEIHSEQLQYDDYSDYFNENVIADDSVKMHLARISLSPDSYLKEMYVINYQAMEPKGVPMDPQKLREETLIAVPKFFLGLARLNEQGKRTFWNTQKTYSASIDGKVISRNNVMRSDSEFMEYSHPENTEVLQEYFVPVKNFEAYIDDLRETLIDEEDFNLLNITIRYVEKNEKAVLSYAKEDMFSLVLLINQGTDAKSIEDTGRVVRNMIDVTLDYGGSYYLPYFGYPTKEQMAEAYPRTREFFDLKEEYDPSGRFMNIFYEEYKQ
ncbi:FAD-binding oxidoreductase [Planomicrobium okeanokoites]|uniref:FAD-binding protein n=1 Tax=Planomicrobium okeanokoites TaxID=244 RepID=A0ABV7KL73_PLAOK|nr:FAD-binding oxidoreductase [Planomicrobium okeanokoites]TAA69393.1 FAD-binding oxidoreductase [Planomicrobium okeanokoites]